MPETTGGLVGNMGNYYKGSWVKGLGGWGLGFGGWGLGLGGSREQRNIPSIWYRNCVGNEELDP